MNKYFNGKIVDDGELKKPELNLSLSRGLEELGQPFPLLFLY